MFLFIFADVQTVPSECNSPQTENQSSDEQNNSIVRSSPERLLSPLSPSDKSIAIKVSITFYV